MNLFADIRATVLEALGAMQTDGALPEALDFANVTVEPPRDPVSYTHLTLPTICSV